MDEPGGELLLGGGGEPKLSCNDTVDSVDEQWLCSWTSWNKHQLRWSNLWILWYIYNIVTNKLLSINSSIIHLTNIFDLKQVSA